MRTSLYTLLLATMCLLTARAVDPSSASDAKPKTIDVTGAVRAPNAIPWTPDLTITKAIKRAGGPSWRAPKNVRLIRGADHTLIELRRITRGEIPDPKLQPGDTIEVPE